MPDILFDAGGHGASTAGARNRVGSAAERREHFSSSRTVAPTQSIDDAYRKWNPIHASHLDATGKPFAMSARPRIANTLMHLKKGFFKGRVNPESLFNFGTAND